MWRDNKCHKKGSSFACKLTADNAYSTKESSLLVDTGANAWILNDRSKFLKFDDKFKPEIIT